MIHKRNQVVEMASQIKVIEEIVHGLNHEGHIPQSSSVDKRLIKQLLEAYDKKFINESMLSDVISDAAFARRLEKIGTESFAPLSSDEINQVAIEVEQQIYALPEEYTFYFKLPMSKADIPKNVIGPRITIYTAKTDKLRPQNANDEHISSQKQAAISLLGALKQPTPIYKKGDVILDIKTSGIITRYAQVKLDSHDPLYLYKIILYLLEAQNTFENIRSPSEIYGIDPPALTYTAFSSSGNFERTFYADSRDSKLINSKQFHQGLAEMGDLDGRLKLIRQLLSKLPTSSPGFLMESQRQLRNAAYWIYESNKSMETHTKIVLTCTALDALIGSQNDAKEQKAEIISQAISTNVTYEDQVKKAVTQLYSLRNAIVHGSIEINTMNDFIFEGEDSQRFTLFQSQIALKSYFINRMKKFRVSVDKISS